MRLTYSLSILLYIISVLTVFGQNVFSLNLNYNYDSLDYIDSAWKKLDANGKTIFINGETHNVLANRMIHFKYFVFLYYYSNVRTYIMEGSPSFIYFINKYVQTGDERILEKMRSFVPDRPTKQYSIEIESDYFNFLRKFYEFNKSLPYNEKIKISSIDVDSFFYSKDLINDILE
jgi:hypothetical protein